MVAVQRIPKLTRTFLALERKLIITEGECVPMAGAEMHRYHGVSVVYLQHAVLCHELLVVTPSACMQSLPWVGKSPRGWSAFVYLGFVSSGAGTFWLRALGRSEIRDFSPAFFPPSCSID